MKHLAVFSRSFPKKAFVWLALALFPGVALSEFDIAQQPLTVDVQVEPNVLYIFDDSGSMDWTYMPDNTSSPAALSKAPTWNRQYYSPDITYQPPYHYDSGRLVSMGSGLVSIDQANGRFTVRNNVYSNSPGTFVFSNLNGTGEGTTSGGAAAVYYDYVPGFYSMRDNPDFNRNVPVESDQFNYEYWAFRTAQPGAFFIRNGATRNIRADRTAAVNSTMVGNRACPNLFEGSTESAEYHESLGNTITFRSSNSYLSKFNGLVKGIPHAQCVYSYRLWDVDIPGVDQPYSSRATWYETWAGSAAPENNPRLMGLPVGRPWCNNSTGTSTTIPATNTATSQATPWVAITGTGNTVGTASNRSCHVGRHRIGDTNGDGRFDANDNLDAPVSHFEYRGEDFIGTCKAAGDASADGRCYGLNGPEQSRERLISKFVTPEGEIRIEDVPRRRTGREEIENFANWFAYYRTRAMAARAGTSLAFAQLIDKNDTTKPGRTMNGKYIRLGYDTINRLTSNTVGLGRSAAYTANGTSISSSGVLPFRDFPGNSVIPDSTTPHPYAGKKFVEEFYKWILRTSISGGTPLRRSLNFAGQYYQTAAPWSEYPPLPRQGGNGLNISNDGKPYGCRRAFTILMTDGYDNGGNPSTLPGNADCRPQPRIDYIEEGTTTIARSTHNPTPRQVGDPVTGIKPEYNFFDATAYAAGVPQGPFCGENLARFGGTGNYTVSESLADIAAYYWQTDLQPSIPNQVPSTKKSNAFWQHMQTFTIGLGVQGRMSDKEVNEFLKDPARVKDKNIFWTFPTGLDTNYEIIDDLMHAGLNGRGGTAAAQDPGEFVSKLSQLLGEIVGELSTKTGYQTPQGEIEAESVKASFNGDGPWSGNMEGTSLKYCTKTRIKNGECLKEGELMKSPSWSAADVLRTRINTLGFADRKIFTWDGINGVRFNSGLPTSIKNAIDVGIERGDPSGNLDNCPFPRSSVADACMLKGTTPYSVELLIDYLRGDSQYEDNASAYAGVSYNGFRDRTGQSGKVYLMDFVNSVPYQLGIAGARPEKGSFGGHFDYGWSGWKCGSDGLPANPAKDGSCDPAVDPYSFLTSLEIREYDERLGQKIAKFNSSDHERGVAFVGGNGGMLHAFRVGGRGDGIHPIAGEELFTFIPAAVHGKLKELSDPTYDGKHTYTVDGTPFASDIILDGQWKSVVVGSTGAGGKSFFALDVEDVLTRGFTEGDVLWEFTHSNLGAPANGEPVIQPVAGMPGNWAVTFGNGYNSENHRAVLFVVQLARTGNPVFYELDTGVGDASNPNGLGTPMLLNLSGDGRAEFAYAGDALGNLWKFDLINMTVVEKILVATDPAGVLQPITAPPGISQKGLNMKPPLVQVIVGTGKFFEKDDVKDKQVQSIYGVRDFAPEATVGTVATRNRLLVRNYLRDDGATDTFTAFSGNQFFYPGWELEHGPGVAYDQAAGQMGYVIDLNADRMEGWRIGVQGTDLTITAGRNYLMPIKIPRDNPCLSMDSGALAEIDPLHGHWVRAMMWKDIRNNSNIWRDDKTQGLEVERDSKMQRWGRLIEVPAPSGYTFGSVTYKTNVYDNPRFAMPPPDKLSRPPECETIFNPGTEEGTIICEGRAGRQSWRQIR